ncbi:MAG TPA: hypothetical protein IAA98_13535 [Candidatus Avipropionibacterium avicola]|uniref:endopeptidase La n=1 Tax=Candidatus Avipropionibacterium avicola TaxID=2840701 RepID=A0A9D1H1Y0_9ACTN|nr:hypothetical protein [Candidatus Avipropionibacterium avicola]
METPEPEAPDLDAPDLEQPVRVPWWRRPIWMTPQSWTSLAASIGFLCAVMVLALVPAPYVVWAPGGTVDTLGHDASGAPLVEVSGAETHPVSGQLDLTTVSVTRVDSGLGFAPAFVAWLRRGFDTLDRDLYYPPGTTAESSRQERAAMMSQSQLSARVAAARAAGLPVSPHPMIAGVVVGGPSDPALQPGDVVLSVAGQPVEDADTVLVALAAALTEGDLGDGDELDWQVRRDGEDLTVTTSVRAGDTVEDRLGVQLIDGFDTPLTVRYGIDEEIGGPSAGLVFSLAIYDVVTPGELLAGRHVAGTGTIDTDGRVGAIGGIQSKVVAAERAGATIFLVPADNCEDLAGLRTDLDLIRIATLDEAIDALTALHDDNHLHDGNHQEVPRC